jgi:multidrug transporter EmrE-like cation transporter
MEKPSAVKQFDALYLGGYALVVIGGVLSVSTMRAAMSAAGLPAAAGPVLYGSTLFGVVIVGLLWFFTSPKHSNVAKWIALVFVVLGILGSLRSLVGPATEINGAVITVNRTALLLGLVGQICQAIGLSRLFTPAGKAWMGQTAPADRYPATGAVGVAPARDPYAPDQPPYPPAR